MNATPTVFSFETNYKIRAVAVDSSPWFIAADVCNAIGIKHTASAMRSLDDDEKGVHSMHTPGGQQDFTTISESGLYTLILRCRDAVTPGTIPYRFRKWVTSEVLPSIRQTGKYAVGKPETLGDLVGSEGTLGARDKRRSIKRSHSNAANSIAEKCVPMIMDALREHQYHYSNTEVSPDDVLPLLKVSYEKQVEKMQIFALLSELSSNGHDISGAFREVEIMRHVITSYQKLLRDLQTHTAYVSCAIQNHKL